PPAFEPARPEDRTAIACEIAVRELEQRVALGQVRPCTHPSDLHEWFVIVATKARLHAEFDPCDPGPVHTQRIHAMEKPKPHASSLQALVCGSEHGIPHACGHAPEQRAPISTEDLEERAEPRTGRDRPLARPWTSIG